MARRGRAVNNDLDDAEATNRDVTPDDRPSKIRRIRVACQRCQRRKIKCDGGLPKCSACSRANSNCVDGKKITDDGSITRIDAAVLHGYIENLEEILRDRAPDVDLTSLRPPRDTNIPMLQDGRAPSNREISLCDQDPVISETETNNHTTVADEMFRNHETDRQSQSGRAAVAPVRQEITHDIGLVPLSAGVSKYVGPSSGFSLTNIILKRAKRGNDVNIFLDDDRSINLESPSTTTSRSLLAIEPGSLPVSMAQAAHLSRIYFEHVHPQYPFLHEPTFFDLLQTKYRATGHAAPWITFQVTMVLAISASILAKRLPIPFSGESLCALALRDLGSIDTQGSLQGLQCLLLVYMFTLHSPFSGINPWYLNYQFLATALDIGLQRDSASSDSTNNPFDGEMRRRIFWVIYTIDRTLATTLGRPIGLRDEGCDLRQPIGTEDHDLHNPALEARSQGELSASIQAGSMLCAKALFSYAQLNSEIKYILHSVNKKSPPYTYPQIPDLATWQNDLWQRLRNCDSKAPKFTDDRHYLTIICSIRYHEVTMHLFRPTPHIRNPTQSSLLRCHDSAVQTIELWKSLYEADRITYSWITIHSVCLSALTMLYCIWTSQDIAASTQIDAFTNIMRDASVLLSAAGEYWIEARKSRHRLDTLASATVRWLADRLRAQPTSAARRPRQSETTPVIDVNCPNSTLEINQHDPSTLQQRISNQTVGLSYDCATPTPYLGNTPQEQVDACPAPLLMDVNGYISNEDLASFLGAPDIFTSDNAFLMDSMFTDYQPLFELGNIGAGSNWSL